MKYRTFRPVPSSCRFTLPAIQHVSGHFYGTISVRVLTEELPISPKVQTLNRDQTGGEKRLSPLFRCPCFGPCPSQGVCLVWLLCLKRVSIILLHTSVATGRSLATSWQLLPWLESNWPITAHSKICTYPLCCIIPSLR